MLLSDNLAFKEKFKSFKNPSKSFWVYSLQTKIQTFSPYNISIDQERKREQQIFICITH